MTKTRHGLALTACASIALLAGCGSDDSSDSTTASATAAAPESISEIDVDTGPFESDEDFAAAVNGYCDEAGVIYSRTPVYGITAEGLAAEFTTLVANENEDLAKTESIEAPDALADGWADYNDANAKLIASHEKVLDAAASGDVAAANDLLFTDATKAGDDVAAANDELGLECSDPDRPISDAEPAAATAAAAAAPQPTNTIDEAAEEFLAALQSGDCKEIVAVSNSQSRVSVGLSPTRRQATARPWLSAGPRARLSAPPSSGRSGPSSSAPGPATSPTTTSRWTAGATTP